MTDENSAIPKLAEHLQSISPGKVTEADEVLDNLADCWDEFDGSNVTEMAPHKVCRAEDVNWQPPTLSFTIERHGGTVQGSVYAELQDWSVDIDKKTAMCSDGGRRQVGKKAKNVYVKPIAKEIAMLVLGGHKNDERLKWYDDGRVKVQVGKVIPGGILVAKATLAGRRKGFRKALREILEKAGWKESKLHTYEPPSP